MSAQYSEGNVRVEDPQLDGEPLQVHISQGFQTRHLELTRDEALLLMHALQTVLNTPWGN